MLALWECWLLTCSGPSADAPPACLQTDTFQYSCLQPADSLPLSATDSFDITYTASLAPGGSTLNMVCGASEYVSLISVRSSAIAPQTERAALVPTTWLLFMAAPEVTWLERPAMGIRRPGCRV